MKIGYARVSTRNQHPEAQLDALNAAGCEKVLGQRGAARMTEEP
jgi:DNA invertase Pin-like site-specific DNA recombinase